MAAQFHWKSGLEKKNYQKAEDIRIKRRYLAGAVLLGVTLIVQLMARNGDGFGEWYAVHIYPLLVWGIGGAFGAFPFSVVEIGLYGFVIFWVGYGVLCLREGIRENIWRGLNRIGAGAVLVLGVLGFLYTVNCGINYYRVPFSSYLDLDLGGFSQKELEELCMRLKGELEAAAEAVVKEYGGIVPDSKISRGFPEQAREDMRRLADQYPQLSVHYPRPKPVAVSKILSLQSLSGVYSPFTIEANYNQDMTAYNIPHTACHELSHLTGFMREEEANFIGYLACVGSESAYSRYSGYALGFIYANNALFRQNPQLASRLHDSLPQEVKEDFEKNNEFWKRYEGKISEASTKVNDTYLKANSQTEGVKSYGRMVDLMLAYYKNID